MSVVGGGPGGTSADHSAISTAKRRTGKGGRIKENTTKIRNIKQYLLTTLYNAPATIDNYYSALVQHDLYGGSRD